MPSSWFELSKQDQSEILELAANQTGLPPHLLEKDIWVVWVLNVLFSSPLGQDLSFKGGTSLSKVFKIINRFSEDIDLTYDIRKIVPDLLKDGSPLPISQSQQKKISATVRSRLTLLIKYYVIPILNNALQQSGLSALLQIDGNNEDKLTINYPASKHGTGYANPRILLEFGARATGEPRESHHVICDAALLFTEIQFPVANPLVLLAERTFWEKATAIHVYCQQGRLRGERYSRHWYDLDAISKTLHYQRALQDHQLAMQVALHKSIFFSEKDRNGNRINYKNAVLGMIQLVPSGISLQILEEDYSAMLADGLLRMNFPKFTNLIDRCSEIQDQINHAFS